MIQICIQCGKEYKTSHSVQQHCGKKCAYKSSRRPLKICEFCNKEYKAKKSTQIHCSQQCANKAHSALWDLPKTKTCEQCGEEYKPAPKWRNRQKYCGLKCRRKAQCGANSHFWKGGVAAKNQIIRTSAEFKQWAKDVKIRDNFTCQICSTRRGPLASHHILCFALYEEYRFDVDNGVCLCSACHAGLESGLRARNVLFIKLNRFLGWRMFNLIKRLVC